MVHYSPVVQAYLKLKLACWSTWDEPISGRSFGYSVAANYNGNPCEIRFGAFIGWAEHMSWWIDLAGRLSMPKLDQLGLLDIEHQAGGHSVIPWFCVAAPAALHSSYVAFVGDLCSHYYHAHGGWMDGLATPVEEDEQYRERLKAVGLTASCHSERNRLMESVYPMDGTDKNLNLLLAQPSEALAALEPLLLDATARNRLKIFIIAENSD